MPNVDSGAAGSMGIAELLGQAGALFAALAGTRDDPRATELQVLADEIGRRAARLRTPVTCVCACGATLTDQDERDDHFAEAFTPAGDIGADGRVHAEVAPGTPVPWLPPSPTGMPKNEEHSFVLPSLTCTYLSLLADQPKFLRRAPPGLPHSPHRGRAGRNDGHPPGPAPSRVAAGRAPAMPGAAATVFPSAERPGLPAPGHAPVAFLPNYWHRPYPEPAWAGASAPGPSAQEAH
jgi:hypothetical protein